MKSLSDRINALSVSQTLAMAAKTRELKAQGKDIIGLSLGEPDFEIPDFIKEEAIKAIQEGYKSYSPVDGYLDLKEAIVEKFKRDNGLVYDVSQISVSTGAKQSIANIALVLLNKGDEVLLPAPYWVSYAEISKLADAIPIEIRTSVDTDFKITPEQLEQAITPKTKLIIFSSPCNPTGSVYTKEELKKLVEVLERYPQIYILSDEIYEYINFKGTHCSIASFDSMYDRTITVNGLSKSYAMTGWRLGYAAGPLEVMKAYNKLQGQVTSGTCNIVQRAAISAIKAPSNTIDYMVKEFKQRRDFVVDKLRQIEGFNVNIPEGAFYVFPDISYFFGKTLQGSKIENPSDLSMYLLEKASVAVVTGEAFGDSNCIRISYSASIDLLEEALMRIKKAVS